MTDKAERGGLTVESRQWTDTGAEDEILKAAISKYGKNVSVSRVNGSRLGVRVLIILAMGAYLVAPRAKDAQAVQGAMV